MVGADGGGDRHIQHGGHRHTAALTLPLVEYLLPVVTKSFGRTSQCESGEEGFLRWDLSSGVASQPCERSHSEPPGTQTGPLWVARALTGRRSRQVPGILQLPAVGSKADSTGPALLEAHRLKRQEVLHAGVEFIRAIGRVVFS